jgi:hypothetical protein
VKSVVLYFDSEFGNASSVTTKRRIVVRFARKIVAEHKHGNLPGVISTPLAIFAQPAHRLNKDLTIFKSQLDGTNPGRIADSLQPFRPTSSAPAARIQDKFSHESATIAVSACP